MLRPELVVACGPRQTFTNSLSRGGLTPRDGFLHGCETEARGFLAF